MNSDFPEKFGVILGHAPGNVPVYSSDYDSVDEKELPARHTYRNYVDNVFMGYKWQCVEFARRWLYLNCGYIFEDVAMAYEIFNLSRVRVCKDNSTLPLHSFQNGSKRFPKPGCLLIWDEGGDFKETGHVAIVTEVFPDRIRFAEQNFDHIKWTEGANYSRELKAKIDSFGGYWIECARSDSNILGWVVQTEDGEHAYKESQPDSKLFSLKLKKAQKLTRSSELWLNIANPDEAAYVETYGTPIQDRKCDIADYYIMSSSAQMQLKKATNDLHAMFMHATDYVLENEDLLEKFCIPKQLWPKLHSSWDNRRNEMITGRFDIGLTPEGLKVYEYNADSASCYMECGKIQERWSKHFGATEGSCGGEKLHKKLVEAWKESGVTETIHIMLDLDSEENYHALYMQSAMNEAGLSSKMVHGFSELHWGPNGKVLDNENNEIKYVWKTWAWETALDQIREEISQDENCDKSKRPRLVDVLLAKEVIVFEPFWTLIPSNKAILPILSSLYPNHPYLLHSSFTLAENDYPHGYVVKPIVGRAGANIQLFDKDKKLVESTQGKFEKRDQIYQELFPLQKIDGKNIQLASFTVLGHYAGVNVRVDKSAIVVSGSDLPTLRVVNDEEFLKT